MDALAEASGVLPAGAVLCVVCIFSLCLLGFCVHVRHVCLLPHSQKQAVNIETLVSCEPPLAGTPAW